MKKAQTIQQFIKENPDKVHTVDSEKLEKANENIKNAISGKNIQMTEKERIRKDIAHRLSVAETMLDASPNNEAWHLVYSELKSILSFIDKRENEKETIIWHNADEEPQENTKIVWYAIGDCIRMCTHTKDMVHGGMTKWAYADELLNLKTQEPIESLPKIKGWVARDKKWFDEENRLTFFFTKPERHDSILAVSEGWWNAKSDEHCCEGFRIDKNLFPELTWEDEPIEVEITIKHC